MQWLRCLSILKGLKMGRSDDYVKVKVILVMRTQNAILINCDAKADRLAWIPLSLIHAADEKSVNNSKMTEIVEFRLREWKATELDL